MGTFSRRTAAILAALVFGAPWPASALEPATLQLNWFPIADHMPLYLAKKRGYYKDEGIDLKIIRGFGSGDTAQKIELKQAEFGISDTPTILIARSKGAEVKVIGMVFDKGPSNVFVWADSGIRSPKDLVGKSIAAPPGDSHRLLWPSFAKVNGIDPDSITLVNVKPEGKQAILASKRVDAVFDLYTGFPFWEKAMGKGNVGNILFADHGVSIYAHAYLAHDETIAKKPDLVRGFLRATYKGWHDALKEPQAAADALAEEVAGTDKEAYLASFDAVRKLIETDRYRKAGIGSIDPEQMQRTIDVVKAGGQMGDKPVGLKEAYADTVLPRIDLPK
jgi:NitT/TauT family transport system substrate-binding protein